MTQLKLKTFYGLLTEYFLTDKAWRDKLGIALNRYQRGNELLNTLKDPVVIMGFGGLIIGVSLKFIPVFVLPVLAIAWLFSCYTLGYIDEKFGFWRNQQNHLSGTINPVMKQISEDIKQIKDYLKI